MSITKFVYSTSTGDPLLIYDDLIYDDHSHRFDILFEQSSTSLRTKGGWIGEGRMVVHLLDCQPPVKWHASHHRHLPQIPHSLAVRTALVTWCILHAQILNLRVYLPTLSSHRLRSPHAPSSQLSLLPRPFDPLDAGLVALEFLHRSRLISAPQAVPR